MNKEKKITVKHYLNVNLKPYIINGEKKYKIYILITNNAHNTKIKSEITESEFSEKEYIKLLKETDNIIKSNIKIETENINKTIELIYKDNKFFTGTIFSQYYNKFRTPLKNIIFIDLAIDENTLQKPFINTIHYWKSNEKFNIKEYKPFLDGYYYDNFINKNINNFSFVLIENINILDIYAGSLLIEKNRKEFVSNFVTFFKDKLSIEDINIILSKIDKEIKRFYQNNNYF